MVQVRCPEGACMLGDRFHENVAYCEEIDSGLDPR